ncbi:MAG TPA: Crp/Fnr family transcriptional regulator [Anaerolineae bacterium]|nr:Crp/Fnr family transcriptional regulator [Anaerolineae bacterium]HMR67517.1 Crp/Fnr family transcriptional regulator [Anaerolineae bacterium]
MPTASSGQTIPRRVSLLQNVPLFADLNKTDLGRLVHDFHLRVYNKNEAIFHQGDMSRELYIILKGKIRIFKISPAGDETSLNIFADYDLFGELATIDQKPRSASAKAVVRTTLLVMAHSQFEAHVQAMPQLALSLNRLLTQKLRWTAAYAAAVAQYDAAARLLHILLLFNEKFGEEIVPGKQYVLDLSLNQTDLASFVGARREWVNRLMGDWRKRGLIDYDAGKIIILDLPRVEQERDGRIEGFQDEVKW